MLQHEKGTQHPQNHAGNKTCGHVVSAMPETQINTHKQALGISELGPVSHFRC